MYHRNITSRLLEALSDSPVVLLNGARQTGKTTLVRALADQGHPATYLTLDDPTVLAAAVDDPVGFITGLSGPVIIDEVQHAPVLFPAIKMAVDLDQSPGRFLLTGSANVLLLPKISESLAGRIEIITLWPLSQSEIAGFHSSVCDLILSSEPLPVSLPPVDRTDLVDRMLAGGYPEPLARPNPSRRRAWFHAYVTTILQRDVRDIANIEGVSRLPRLLSLLAARTASLMNQSDVAVAVGIPYATLNRYLSVLEATFLVQLLPAWTTNLNLRLVKSPKLLINDTGLAANLLGADRERVLADGRLLGALLETFVAMDLGKDASWSVGEPHLYHYRTHARHEVDLVLESPSGDIAGVEVKASAGVSVSDFKGLKSLRESAGDRFVRGIVLYTSERTVPFDDRLSAVPISILWNR